MRKTTLLVITIAFTLVGCSIQATPTINTPTSITPTDPAPQEQPTTAPAEESPSNDPTGSSEEMSSKDSNMAQVVTYQIVPGESQVTYQVGETFINQDNVFKVAVGVTTQVSGEVVVDHTNPQNSTVGTISIDISQFTSDSSRRDNQIRQNWLESSRYPIATFVPTQIAGLPASGEEGVDYPIQITGDLTVREVTKSVTFEATIRLVGDTLSGEATTTILMSDFEVGPIDIAGILKTEDEARLTLNFIARPLANQ